MSPAATMITGAAAAGDEKDRVTSPAVSSTVMSPATPRVTFVRRLTHTLPANAASCRLMNAGDSTRSEDEIRVVHCGLPCVALVLAERGDHRCRAARFPVPPVPLARSRIWGCCAHLNLFHAPCGALASLIGPSRVHHVRHRGKTGGVRRGPWVPFPVAPSQEAHHRQQT